MARPRGQFCKRCGYDLAGIATPVCPECSRPFTPGDASTYDAVPWGTRRRRRRRRILIVTGTLAFLGLLVALFPRGYVQAAFTIGRASGPSIQITRTEPLPPRWVRRISNLRYPGWTSRSEVPPLPESKFISFTARSFRLTRDGYQSQGSCSAWGDSSEAGTMTINDVLATPENAAAVFETIIPDMVAGKSYGVSLGTLPNKPAGSAYGK